MGEFKATREMNVTYKGRPMAVKLSIVSKTGDPYDFDKELHAISAVENVFLKPGNDILGWKKLKVKCG